LTRDRIDPKTYGTASRTITLDLSAWAKIYEAATIMEMDFKTAMTKAIAILYSQAKSVESKSMAAIPNIESE